MNTRVERWNEGKVKRSLYAMQLLFTISISYVLCLLHVCEKIMVIGTLKARDMTLF